jgi:EmrB/QacA subfamily drug resistance transporter
MSHSTAADPPVGGSRRWWALVAMCMAFFMINLDMTVVNVALPVIQRELDASLAELEWTVNGLILTTAVLLVTAGRLGDIFGRRRVFLLGVGIFAVSSAAIGLAPSPGWLVAGRVLQGVGAAVMMPATLAIIVQEFPPRERGKAIGTWASVAALALASGPVVGGVITEELSWRWIFFLNVPIAAAAVVVTLLAVRESRDHSVERRVDVWGNVTLILGLTALVLALIEGNEWGWGSPSIIALLAVAPVALVAFAVLETRVRFPLVQFADVRSKSFLGASVVALINQFCMISMFFFISLYMQNVLGYSPLEAGLGFLPATIMAIVGPPITGRLVDRLGPRPLIGGGLPVIAAALLWLSFVNVDTGYGVLFGGFLLMGIGISLVMPAVSTAGMNAVDRTKSGVASGLLAMSRLVGGTLGVAVLGAIVAGLGRGRLAELLPGLSDRERGGLAEHLAARSFPGGDAEIGEAVHEAFISGLAAGLRVSAAFAVAGAVVGLLLIQRSRAAAPAAAAPAQASSSSKAMADEARP